MLETFNQEFGVDVDNKTTPFADFWNSINRRWTVNVDVNNFIIFISSLSSDDPHNFKIL